MILKLKIFYCSLEIFISSIYLIYTYLLLKIYLCIVFSIIFLSNCFQFFFITEYIFAALPKTQRGQPLVLGGDPKGKNFLYTNGNSVIIRNIDVNCYIIANVFSFVKAI